MCGNTKLHTIKKLIQILFRETYRRTERFYYAYIMMLCNRTCMCSN